MKKLEFEKLKEKPVEELIRDLEAAREELRNLKFDLTSGKLKDYKALEETKKKIARILTIINTKK